jgi:hypothetical protein
MNTYQWTIISISTLPSPPAPIEDCAASAQFMVIGTSNDNPSITAEFNGTAEFSIPNNGENLTPYANLTEEQVISWIQSDSDLIANIQANLDKQIEDKINAPILPTATLLPWDLG